MDCSPPGSSIHGILQAKILEWVAMPLSIFQGVDPECHNHGMWEGVMSPAVNMMQPSAWIRQQTLLRSRRCFIYAGLSWLSTGPGRLHWNLPAAQKLPEAEKIMADL